MQPAAYLAVHTDVRATFDSESAKGGFDFVRLLPGLEASPRDPASWSRSCDVPKLAGSMLEEVMQVLETAPSGFCLSISKRGLFANDLPRWFLDFDIKMRSTLVHGLRATSIAAEHWFAVTENRILAL